MSREYAKRTIESILCHEGKGQLFDQFDIQFGIDWALKNGIDLEVSMDYEKKTGYRYSPRAEYTYTS